MTRFRFLLLALTAIFATHAGVCRAEVPCPWLNSATAGGFLGGDVQKTVSGVTDAGDATCEFTRPSSRLSIAVHTMADIQKEFPGYLALCQNPVTLKAIGNIAVRCIAKSGPSAGSEIIVGRVRERAFLITIKAEWIADPPSTPTKTRNPISDNSENLAEQVAGSMF